MKSRQETAGPRQSLPLAEALVLALCVPAAGSLALLLRFGAELFPVGLAVLVNQSNLGWEGRGDKGRLRKRCRLASFGVLVVILIGES